MAECFFKASKGEHLQSQPSRVTILQDTPDLGRGTPHLSHEPLFPPTLTGRGLWGTLATGALLKVTQQEGDGAFLFFSPGGVSGCGREWRRHSSWKSSEAER